MRPTNARFASFATSATAVAAGLLLAACGGGDNAPTHAFAQSITFASPGAQAMGSTPQTLSATSTSGLSVSFASTTPDVCAVSGTSLSLVSAGTCSVTASQAGDGTYSAAAPVTQSFSVTPALSAQTITFDSPGDQTMGAAPSALVATATSGLAVSFTSSTSSVCTVSGSTLTLVASGTCTITASQPGDAITWAAATPVSQSFNVAGTAVSAALTFSSGFGAGNTTVEGGAFGGYSGSDVDGWNCAPGNCGSGGAFTPSVTADASNFYYYYQTATPPAVGEYVGIYVQAPGLTTGLSTSADTPGLQLTTQTAMKFNFNQNPEWFGSATHNVGVLLTLGKLYTFNGAACNVKLLSVFTPSSVSATDYTIPLSSFAVNQSCGVAGLTAAAALAAAPISQVDFQGDGGSAALSDGSKTTGANTSVPTSGGTAVYPTTLVVNGAITFQ
jgi:hypothetical protein